MILRARAVLPISSPPVSDGGVIVHDDRLVSVGRWKDLSSSAYEEVIDLGETVLMPGLINAHCHLDYTTMAGSFTPPKKFTDWLKLITAAKGQLTYSEFAESWIAGAKMLLRTGTTTVGDIENVPELLPDIWDATPLRVISFLEMTGVKSRRSPRAILEEALNRLTNLPVSRCGAGLSPHAPYSTLPELITLSARVARDRHWPFAIHVAESPDEFDMFMRGRGEMFDWLRRNERDMSDCGLGSPVAHLHRAGALQPNLLAIHVNYLAPGDTALLGGAGVSVVHCPRSHEFFKHDPFPFSQLKDAQVNICLATDSLASVSKSPQPLELNLFEEMRLFADNRPEIAPQEIVRMTTINAAQALGLRGQVGELTPGTFADIIALPFEGKISHVHETIVHHRGAVAGNMISGSWAIAPAGMALAGTNERI